MIPSTVNCAHHGSKASERTSSGASSGDLPSSNSIWTKMATYATTSSTASTTTPSTANCSNFRATPTACPSTCSLESSLSARNAHSASLPNCCQLCSTSAEIWRTGRGSATSSECPFANTPMMLETRKPANALLSMPSGKGQMQSIYIPRRANCTSSRLATRREQPNSTRPLPTTGTAR